MQDLTLRVLDPKSAKSADMHDARLDPKAARLDPKAAKNVKAIHGPIVSIVPLDERYLAISYFPNSVAIYDQRQDRYVSTPFYHDNLSLKDLYNVSSQAISANQWLWQTQHKLFLLNTDLFTTNKSPLKLLLKTDNDDYIHNVDYNPITKQLYVKTHKELWFANSLHAKLTLIHTTAKVDTSILYATPAIHGEI